MYGDVIMRSVRAPEEPWYKLRSTAERDYFNPAFKVRPGKVTIPEVCADWAARKHIDPTSIMIEPHPKHSHSKDNRRWPWNCWLELLDQWRGPIVHCLPIGSDLQPLPGTTLIRTPTFWHAVAILERCAAYVGSEGGLHHAAGALHKPAVILFSAFNTPEMFGYDFHINIAERDPDGLGWRISNAACQASLQRITVARVLQAMRELP